MANNLKRLILARGQTKGTITTLCKFAESEDVDKASIKALMVKKDRLVTAFSEYSSFNIDVSVLDENNDEDFGHYESIYLSALAAFEDAIEQKSSPGKSPDPGAEHDEEGREREAMKRLPPISIPKFGGEVGGFHDFISLYKSVIDKNTKLSQCDKFYYLKTYLTGEAAELIKHLSLTAHNYVIALQLLSERYDNKNKVINYHVNSLIDLKPISKCTALAIREIISQTRQHVAALKNMNVPVQHWDAIIVCILQRKLDMYTLRCFHLEMKSDADPDLNLLLKFLEQRAAALETVADSQASSNSAVNSGRRTGLVATTTEDKKVTQVCKFCKSNHHQLYKCEKFKLASLSDRVNYAKTNELCTLCLNKHLSKCKFTFKCSICKQKHNSLLHENKPEHEVRQVSLSMNKCNDVLLPIIKVSITDKFGQQFQVRALCDSGSQVSFVLSDLTEKIDCRLVKNYTYIKGICGQSNTVPYTATFNISSTINNYNTQIACCVVQNITSDLPQCEIDTDNLKIPSYVKLADKEFYKTGKISILLGCDVFFKILLREQIPIIPKGLYLHNTHFGYIVAGRVNTRSCSPVSKHTAHILQNSECDSIQNIEKALEQFWKCEQVTEVFTESVSEEALAEKIFSESVMLKDNQFQVDLPLKQNLDQLNMGDSFIRALKRFNNLEKRLQKDPELFRGYKNFIDTYISMGHAKYIDIQSYDLKAGQVYFLPHHPVINENSKTTKLRVVFDGSMPTNLGFSLNDMLLNGPNTQNELFNILVLFRLHRYVLFSDIQKMFREVILNPKHCALQNILWRDAPNKEIQCAQLQTVTYGLKSSTFLATRCLNELASRFAHIYPEGAHILLNHCYVDDICTGNNDLQKLLDMKNQLIAILKLGGFKLHKWSSNSEYVLSDIPCALQISNEIDLCKGDDQYVKTLGIKYNTQTDTLNISCPQTELLDVYTKRQTLGFIGRLFDPLGLVGPIIVLAKIIMQQTWLEKISWDSPLPHNLNKKFREFVENLSKTGSIAVKRNIDTQNSTCIELIGFADASQKAHGCCVYLRTINSNGQVKVELLCSKSRVNPIKSLTTPRLELNSALILARLSKKLYDQLIKNNFTIQVHLYVDSQIVLAWLNTEPTKLSVYVANRVKTIRDLTQNASWSYITTNENPADCLSRGIEPHLLKNNQLWWHGPQFLHSKNYTHESTNINISMEIPELKLCNITLTSESDTGFSLYSNYSDINKLKRIIAYIYRFFNNCKIKKEDRVYGHLKIKELEFALKNIIRQDQTQHFSEEITCIRSKKPIKSNLKSLNPFLDGIGILRVGGRLHNANIPYDQKYPIILPKKSFITRLVISNEHKCLLHAGKKLTLASLCQRFYLINGLREVKGVIHKCLVCFKLRAKASEQMMGSLPSDRVNPSRPFEKVGIDYGGPFSIKLHRVRKPQILKAYILLFICFTTKAIHIELASNLTTECFLQALKRFIFRRNKPSIIYCDNGSTFKGANNQLHELYSLHFNQVHQDKITNFTSDLGIEFSFIPSYSPVFGGLWEAGIKSAKYHLKRVVGQQVLTYEELNTIIIQIEGLLNSRPLLSLPSIDPNDMSYLTPAHFLTGASITSFPEPDVTKVPINRLSFWQQCTHMVQSFWKTWSKQYLTQLQNRPKWHSSVPNIEKGVLVLLRVDNTPPLTWPVARVEQTFPGSDGKVRALSVRTRSGKIMRTSVMKVCILPIYE